MDHPLLHFSLGLLLSCGLAASAHADTPILVGVLENISRDDPSDKPSPQVRLAFEYRDHTWTKFPDNYPAKVNWNVVFDGRHIGTIVSQAPLIPGRMLSSVGIENITTAPEKIPQIKQGASDFEYTPGKSITRPLVLVSGPHFSDPEGWKPTSLSSAEKKLTIQSLRAKVPSFEQCPPTDQSSDSSDAPDPPPSLIPYPDDQVVFIKTYRSKLGAVLVGMRLPFEQTRCDFFDDPTFYSYWFVLNGTSIRFLDSQMTPMDAADLTGSGHSVWIFQTLRGEDEDGYELFYDDFASHTDFSWIYH